MVENDDLRNVYKTFEIISFWLLGVWLMLLCAPIILPIVMIKAAKEDMSMWD